jgi:hypothetical protein
VLLRRASWWSVVVLVAALSGPLGCAGSTPGEQGDAGPGGDAAGHADAATDRAGDGAGGDGAAPDGGGVDGGDAGPGGDAAPANDAAPDGPATTLALRGTSGWQVYPGGTYHYGPSIIIDTDQSIHMWTCAPGTSGAWDFIRYRRSTDGGHTWSTDVVALQPTAGSVDAYSTCDPGAVKIGSLYYLGYTSTTNSAGTENDVFIARSTSPTGPFAKWNGSGWGGNPQPILVYPGAASYYGYGEPSLVLVGTKLHVYYSDVQATQFTNVATVDDATVDDWPAHLVDHGHAITRDRPAQDSADVKYADALGRFVAVTTVDRFSPNASVAAYESVDGLVFTPAPWLGARVQCGAHNIGISGDLRGHLDLAAANFVAYAYQPPGNGWGDWPTFLDPVTLTTAPWGTPVAGGVSSIVGGSDWSWSGPRAWDGDPGTIYSSISHAATDAANEWVWVDVGATRALAGVTLVPRGSGYGFPLDFSIQTSPDASTWTDIPGQVYTSYPNPGSTPAALTFGSPVTARFLRLNVTRLGADDFGNHYLQLAEIQPQLAP